MRVPLCREGDNRSRECSSVHKAPVAIVSGGCRSVQGSPVCQKCRSGDRASINQEEVIWSWEQERCSSSKASLGQVSWIRPKGRQSIDGASFSPQRASESWGRRSVRRVPLCLCAAQLIKPQSTRTKRFGHEVWSWGRHQGCNLWRNWFKLLSFSEQLIQPYLERMRGTGTGLLEVRDFLTGETWRLVPPGTEI